MLYTIIWFETQNFVQSEFKCDGHDYDFSRTASFFVFFLNGRLQEISNIIILFGISSSYITWFNQKVCRSGSSTKGSNKNFKKRLNKEYRTILQEYTTRISKRMNMYINGLHSLLPNAKPCHSNCNKWQSVHRINTKINTYMSTLSIEENVMKLTITIWNSLH